MASFCLSTMKSAYTCIKQSWFHKIHSIKSKVKYMKISPSLPMYSLREFASFFLITLFQKGVQFLLLLLLFKGKELHASGVFFPHLITAFEWKLRAYAISTNSSVLGLQSRTLQVQLKSNGG